ncbi:MAG TPA: glycoside hydrolase family 2 TIM barrel-domain containing protein [Mucilaginibacter sp.]|jgi:beta-galactosidase|nr:glycoside hydrolase family 2 TIM barrel-domain containing protein [Mucilaginibacter sp.]
MKKRCILILIGVFVGFNITLAQPTVKQTINSNWEFHKGEINGFPANPSDTTRWDKISLPHSWNITDVTIDSPSYYRGIGWYKKAIYVPASWQGKSVYLYFEGANQVTDIYVNGQFVSNHIGGYTAFCFNIGKLLKYNRASTPNEIIVKVDNSHNENIPPLNADFTFFGGIYRDVYLIAANPVHFNLGNDAGPGVRIKTPMVSDPVADVSIESVITNAGAAKLKVFVSSYIEDAAGNLVKEVATNATLPANGTSSVVQPINGIANPHLWSPDDPYLYKVVTTIKDKDGNVLDETTSPLGLRWFKFDAATGFYLNGKQLKLIGANRHQDYPGMANAVPDAIHERDMQLLKDMGANFIRISHYPQDPAVLEACDRLGLLASIEIPIVNRITQSAAFTQNCENMQREMIAQNFNHPCIIIWAYMNEVLLQPRYKNKSPEQLVYFHDVATLAGKLDSLTRSEDSSRYTMISCHGDFDRYNDAGITRIPQIIGWNLYYGWYAPDFEGFGKFLDRHHQELPDKPLIVTEYGCDGDARLHSLNPQRFDKTVEYQTIYHKHYLKAIMDRQFIAGAAMWCLVDFNSYARIDASPHKNTKGVATDERMPKDVYYYYQANLLKRPFVKIGSHNWTLRGGIGDDNNQCIQPVEVYSNLPEVSLWLNGKLLDKQPVKDKVALFNVPFTNGINELKASAGENGTDYEDFTTINFRMIPVVLNSKTLPFNELNVSLGDARFYIDNKLQQVWLPEKPYSPGSWGYVGGHIFTMRDTNLQKFGTNQNILGTNDDPIYATQRVGLSDFKLDVPDGKYQVTLLFAELLSNKEKQALVYNLNSSAQKAEAANRSFDIFINNQKVADALGGDNYLQPERAFSVRYSIDVTSGAGIDVNFKPIAGETILNGIQVKRIY